MGIDEKTLLVTAQVLGYTVSKFLGIRVIAETPPGRRAARIVSLVAAAELALLLFGVMPRPLRPFSCSLTGCSLGMVFGLVLGVPRGSPGDGGPDGGPVRKLHPRRRRDEIGWDMAPGTGRRRSAGCLVWPG